MKQLWKHFESRSFEQSSKMTNDSIPENSIDEIVLPVCLPVAKPEDQQGEKRKCPKRSKKKSKQKSKP